MPKNDFRNINADAPIPIITGDIHVKYAASEINTNWLLNKILGTKDKQITKISKDEILNFLGILFESKLRMHDDTDSLEWLKQRIQKRYTQSENQRGQSWEDITQTYRFILEQIDALLVMRHYK
jgi:hypothetical protein